MEILTRFLFLPSTQEHVYRPHRVGRSLHHPGNTLGLLFLYSIGVDFYLYSVSHSENKSNIITTIYHAYKIVKR